MDYKLFWSDEAVRNLEEILDDLNYKWTQKEVTNFKEKLNRQLELIISNPYLFPASQYKPRLRKAVLSKQTTIFYEIRENRIYLAYLHLNRKDIGRIK
jgi:plasmid stabilization system protein ParE